ncbi:RNA-binding protein 25-like [Rhizophagus irregularis DAOM 181602=DAOM 197198]|nr:RNA-binding protein 25-like [Rhizophagus irregularis DAOM 181602=DAOM 197198]
MSEHDTDLVFVVWYQDRGAVTNCVSFHVIIITQYRAPYERPPFTTPGGPLTYGQTSRVAILLVLPTQRTAYMAPRPGYGIPLGGISLMAAPDSEVEKFIGGISPGVVTDDWMEKILKTVINYLIFCLESFKHLQTCGTLKSWKQVKDQFRNPKGFGFAEYADADSVLHVLRVLGGEGSGDDKKDKGISCSSCFGGSSPATEIKTEHEEKDDDIYLPLNFLQIKRMLFTERGRDQDRQARESRRESYILDDEEEEQRRQAKRKTEMEMAFKEREIRCQHHREETWQQIRNGGDDDIEADRGQEEYYKDRSSAVVPSKTVQSTNSNACHNGASQNNSDKPKLTLNLASKRRAALMTQLKTDEDFDDEEGIESKRKRRILKDIEIGMNVKWKELEYS